MAAVQVDEDLGFPPHYLEQVIGMAADDKNMTLRFATSLAQAGTPRSASGRLRSLLFPLSFGAQGSEAPLESD